MPVAYEGTCRQRGWIASLWVCATLATGLLCLVSSTSASRADTNVDVNPVLSDPAAIDAGKSLYRRICIVCHLKAGGRGPNLFRNKLSHEKFLNTVLQGRAATQMPSFDKRLSVDEVWQIHAFVMSRDRY